MLVSCRHSAALEWEQLYSDTRLQLERGFLSNALDKAEQGLRDSDQKNPAWNWKFRLLKAEILLAAHKPNEVLNVLTTLPLKPSNGAFAARQKMFEAMAHGLLGHSEQAETCFQESEQLASKEAPEVLPEVALYMGNRAYARALSAGAKSALRGEQYAIAEQKYQLALQLARQHQLPYIETGALIGLGITATGLGRFDEAIDWSLKALTLARVHQFRLAENYAIGNLAWSYGQLGDLDNAIANFLEELKVVDSLNQPVFKERLFNNLGETYLAERNYAAARESHLKALGIARELQQNKSSDEKSTMVFSLSNAATAALEENKMDEAIDYSRQAFSIDPTDPRAILISAKIKVAQHDLAGAQAQLGKILGVKGTEDFVRWDAEDGLARILAEKGRNIPSEDEFREVIDEVEAARSTLRVVENRLAFSSHSGRYYDDYVGFLIKTGQQQKAFQVAEFSRARTLAAGVGIKASIRPGDIKIKQIQALLRRNDKIILAYWLAPKQSFLWLISPSQFKWFTLPGEDQIEQKARDYNRILATNGSDDQREGEALYDMLVAPAEKLIPHGAHLIIVPDGQLDRLSFDALPVPGVAPHYWIEDVETEIASSASILINSNRSERESGRKLLLIGNPVEADKDYPALRHAGEELDKVKGHFNSNEETVVSQDTATPAVYADSHPEQFDLIHFVTHGTAHELRPLESAIILSPGKNSVFKLYARDIVGIRIHPDIVTISACYGAGKRAYSGEGLVGLAWAFLKAGAHQVVAGLWDIDDRVSVDLMDDFYTGLQKGLSASSALHSAKMKLVKSQSGYNRPYYWAPLQVYTGA